MTTAFNITIMVVMSSDPCVQLIDGHKTVQLLRRLSEYTDNIKNV